MPAWRGQGEMCLCIAIIIVIIIIYEVSMYNMEAKGTTSDTDSNIIYGCISKVTITESNKT